MPQIRRYQQEKLESKTTGVPILHKSKAESKLKEAEQLQTIASNIPKLLNIALPQENISLNQAKIQDIQQEYNIKQLELKRAVEEKQNQIDAINTTNSIADISFKLNNYLNFFQKEDFSNNQGYAIFQKYLSTITPEALIKTLNTEGYSDKVKTNILIHSRELSDNTKLKLNEIYNDKELDHKLTQVKTNIDKTMETLSNLKTDRDLKDTLKTVELGLNSVKPFLSESKYYELKTKTLKQIALEGSNSLMNTNIFDTEIKKEGKNFILKSGSYGIDLSEYHLTSEDINNLQIDQIKTLNRKYESTNKLGLKNLVENYSSILSKVYSGQNSVVSLIGLRDDLEAQNKTDTTLLNSLSEYIRLKTQEYTPFIENKNSPIMSEIYKRNISSNNVLREKRANDIIKRKNMLNALDDIISNEKNKASNKIAYDDYLLKQKYDFAGMLDKYFVKTTKEIRIKNTLNDTSQEFLIEAGKTIQLGINKGHLTPEDANNYIKAYVGALDSQLSKPEEQRVDFMKYGLLQFKTLQDIFKMKYPGDTTELSTYSKAENNIPELNNQNALYPSDLNKIQFNAMINYFNTIQNINKRDITRRQGDTALSGELDRVIGLHRQIADSSWKQACFDQRRYSREFLNTVKEQKEFIKNGVKMRYDGLFNSIGSPTIEIYNDNFKQWEKFDTDSWINMYKLTEKPSTVDNILSALSKPIQRLIQPIVDSYYGVTPDTAYSEKYKKLLNTENKK